jgi:hypothetical protein
MISDDLKSAFLARGITTKKRDETNLNFIGKTARVTFSGLANTHAAKFTPTNTVVAAIGDAYTGAPYRTTAHPRTGHAQGSKAVYEPVYGDFDWSKALSDANLKRVLDEAFGNTGAPIPDPNATQSLLKAAYDDKVPVPNTRGLRELSATLANSQLDLLGASDEDTAGIIGVDDVASKTEPVA